MENITAERQNMPKLRKHCLVTVGATATFEELIKAALSDETLENLAEKGYTNVNFQYGNSSGIYEGWSGKHKVDLKINGFNFKPKGLGDEIKKCKKVEGESEEGLVISHAGAGTILDVMRMGVPLIVVPNRSLLDNHQLELAEELERQGYATQGDVKGLTRAIDKACALARKKWGTENKVKGVARMMDDVVGVDGEEEERAGELGLRLDGNQDPYVSKERLIG